MADDQGWELDSGTHLHRVVTGEEGWSRLLRWYVDGELVAEQKSSDDTVVLASEETALGAVRVRSAAFGRPRRVTWFGPDDAVSAKTGAKAAAHAGLGGIDLDPDPGSRAAAREERMRRRPRLYAARHVVEGVAKVVVPIVLVWLLARLAFSVPLPSIPWPSIPWPDIDLPSIPWPDLPSISLPRLDWDPPYWLQVVADNARYVIPVLIGIGVAYGEVRRRRTQDEKKAALRASASARARPEDRGDLGEG